MLVLDGQYVDPKLAHWNQDDCKREQSLVDMEDKPMHNYHPYLKEGKTEMSFVEMINSVQSILPLWPNTPVVNALK